MNKDKLIKLFKKIGFWILVIWFFPYSLLFCFLLEYKKRYEEEKKHYEESSYYFVTKVPYEIAHRRAGVRGEYFIYEELRAFEDKGAKFLFNLYIPKADGTTTEIDVVCITSWGIFVFESKDYSGWIFGSESQNEWTQTLAGRYGVDKFHFYNPIKQNRVHVRYLRSYLKAWNDFPVYSVVVFSNHCELKKIEIISKDAFVVQRNKLFSLISSVIYEQDEVLSDDEIENIYQSLYPLTQVSDDVKTEHIANVYRN